MFAQIIDDEAQRSVAAAGTVGKESQASVEGKTKTEQAKWIGTEIAKKALDAGVERVVFDRGGCKYTGRVKALADAAREAGLKF